MDYRVDPSKPPPAPTVDPWTPNAENTLTRGRSNPGASFSPVPQSTAPRAVLTGSKGFLRDLGYGILSRMPTTDAKKRTDTARDRALQVLREHPQGLSKSELRKQVGGNAGAFRRLVQSMLDKDEIVVTEEHRPTCGLTKVHKIAE